MEQGGIQIRRGTK